MPIWLHDAWFLSSHSDSDDTLISGSSAPMTKPTTSKPCPIKENEKFFCLWKWMKPCTSLPVVRFLCKKETFVPPSSLLLVSSINFCVAPTSRMQFEHFHHRNLGMSSGGRSSPSKGKGKHTFGSFFLILETKPLHHQSEYIPLLIIFQWIY